MITTIVALLGVIALSELTRLYLTHRKVTEEEHFKQKYEGTQKMIWDLTFKRFKTRELREEIRQEYDNRKSQLYSVEEKIKVLPIERGKWTDEQKRLDDQVVLFKKDVERLESQLKQLDIEVEGATPTNEYPEGVVGITQQIDSLVTLRGLLKEWRKQL